MLPNRDTLDTKEVSLADVVAMCSDCDALCASKTHRVLENRSRSPRGWEKEYDEVAKGFQSHEFETCKNSCTRVWKQCPSPAIIRGTSNAPEMQPQLATNTKSWWQIWKSSKPNQQAMQQAIPHQSPVITESEMAVCENVAGDFANVLFMLAHKPTKVQFHTYDPKTGDKYNPDTGEWITRNKSAQVSSNEVSQMLIDKWNTGLHGKAIRPSSEESQSDLPQQQQQQVPAPQSGAQSGVHGTVPRF